MKFLEAYLKHNAELYPQKIAVICGTTKITYSRLWELSSEYSRLIQERGTKKGQIVFFRASQDVDFLITYFGIHIAGAVAAPLEKDCPEDRFSALCIKYGDLILEENIADVLYTTGTTGQSKGVKISYSTIVAEAENLTYSQGFSHNTTFVICGPLNHIGSLSKIFPVVYMGGTLYITEGMKDLDAIFRAFDYPDGNVGTFLVPASIRILLQYGKNELSKLASKIEFIETGAAAINEADMRTLCEILPNTRMYNTYASTETGIISTYNFNDGKCEVGCLGKPMKNSKFYITDEGYVACMGKTLMSGYLEDEEMTKCVLKGDTVFTKDKGYIDNFGMLHLQGRVDDIINVGGYKINPVEVENAAMSFPLVKDCICIAHSHPVLGTILKLLVVYEKKESFSKKTIALHIKSILEQHKVPQLYELVEKIERTFNGKLNRKYYNKN